MSKHTCACSLEYQSLFVSNLHLKKRLVLYLESRKWNCAQSEPHFYDKLAFQVLPWNLNSRLELWNSVVRPLSIQKFKLMFNYLLQLHWLQNNKLSSYSSQISFSTSGQNFIKIAFNGNMNHEWHHSSTPFFQCDSLFLV